MKDFRRILILGATLLVAVTGAALAEQTEPSQPPQQSFWSWLFSSPAPAVAPKAKPAPTARLASAPEAAKPRPSCKLLTCITLVGIGF
jgi:hypothetical protein